MKNRNDRLSNKLLSQISSKISSKLESQTSDTISGNIYSELYRLPHRHILVQLTSEVRTQLKSNTKL